MLSYTSLYKKTEAYVAEMFHNHQPVGLPLHNFDHTESVVKKVNEIAGHYNLSEQDMTVVFVAAWFHDTGYLFEKPQNHEFKSVELMKEFLSKEKVAEEIIERTEKCIMATRA
ncbi:MAG: HD domain-containing protein, partial [Ferruginibacter sp.]|nr:HD domain-containing protein [Ferruginibacter sp.]